MIYILDTRTRAMFDNEADAQIYYRRLVEDEEFARVVPVRRSAKEGLYVVTMTKRESVQSHVR